MSLPPAPSLAARISRLEQLFDAVESADQLAFPVLLDDLRIVTAQLREQARRIDRVVDGATKVVDEGRAQLRSIEKRL
jgi:ABC-type transporter Mla subunit MlaD